MALVAPGTPGDGLHSMRTTRRAGSSIATWLLLAQVVTALPVRTDADEASLTDRPSRAAVSRRMRTAGIEWDTASLTPN